MTSGNFTNIPIDQIFVNRDERQRRELIGVDELADSINRSGLINPLVITRGNTLVAGERRLTACRQLGWTQVPVQYTDELDPTQLQLIELEENIRRIDLTWKDECAAIARYTAIFRQANPKATIEDIAGSLGHKRRVIEQKLMVAREIETGTALVAEADKYSTALNITRRAQERKKASAVESIVAPQVTDIPTPQIDDTPAPRSVPLFNEDFTQWAPAYEGSRFNFIHCDFPYGINADDHTQGQAKSHGGYSDTPELYFTLLSTLASAMDNVVADSAHLMFWFSPKYYHETASLLTEMGWRLPSPYPLIWVKSDNTGILPDPNRGPRWIYEMCFFASRGDRKIVRAVSNAISHPGKDKSIHMSEKPVPVLSHFMRMFIDEHSTVLDPTCGSGNALKAAHACGAASVCGLEIDPTFFQAAKENYYE